MKSCLFVIQEAADVRHIEQAVDAALVAAIFNQTPVILYLNENKSLEALNSNETQASNSLKEKLTQLRDMKIRILNAENLETTSVQSCFNNADVILTY